MTVHSVPVCWWKTLFDVFQDYFLKNKPGGCDYDLKWTVINDVGILKKVLVGPIPQYGEKKFMDFMLDRWDRKRIRDIPGIGMVFAERLEANLGGYCSVQQLYHMFCYWNCDETIFRIFLCSACDAWSSRESHIARTVEAFKQRHLLCNGHPVILRDPDPFAPEQ